VANYLDFLLAVDDYIRDNPSGCVSSGTDMWTVAARAGLAKWGDPDPPRWTGELVYLDYLIHAPKSSGDVGPEFPGTMWEQNEVQRYHDYRLTALGREEADRLRRRGREAITDAVLGGRLPTLIRSWMSDGQRGAISAPLTQLQTALDNDHAPAVIGASKDLVEAACKVSLERRQQQVPASTSLTDLYKRTLPEITDPSAVALGRSLTASVQRLAEFRNAAGSGHGRASAPEVGATDAHLAASASVAIAEYVLGGV
jgi:hypothetical protein